MSSCSEGMDDGSIEIGERFLSDKDEEDVPCVGDGECCSDGIHWWECLTKTL